MERLKALLGRKIGGVPILYLAGGAVVILGVVAWRMKASPSAAADPASGVDGVTGQEVGSDPATGDVPGLVASNPYTGFNTGSTVTTYTPMPSDTVQSPAPETTNDQWLKDAAKKVSEVKPTITPIDAQEALNKYLDGAPLTAPEKEIVNEAIKQVGQAPTTPIAAPVPEAIVPDKTNTDWAKDGAEWAVKELGVDGSAAQGALARYILGDDRSYDDQQIVDKVIKAKGLPPDPINPSGKIGGAPAQKQFTSFPGRHRVKGGADNGYPQLAMLYYNRNDLATLNLLRGANPALGPNGPWADGTYVNVPAYHVPKWFKTTAAIRSDTQVAKKNGISINQLKALNPGMSFPAKVNVNVRVG